MILAVDANIQVHDQQTTEWEKYGISTKRVDTVHDAIVKLSAGEKYIFIAINEDTVSNMWDMLSILCDSTTIPVCIITSTYTGAKKAKALSLGARSYDPFNEYDKDNVLAALEIIKNHNKLPKRSGKGAPVLVSGDIILSPPRRKVFIKGAPVPLRKKEFDILYYFILNVDFALSYQQISRRIWGRAYEEVGHHTVWNHVYALRQKIEKALQSEEYIRTVIDYGYRFLPPSNSTPD